MTTSMTAAPRAVTPDAHRIARTAQEPSSGPSILRPGERSVVAMRRRAVIAPGGLASRTALAASSLVTAQDTDGAAWWIAADAVWSDAETGGRPGTPRPIGLAAATSRLHALLTGLSDRLGWEAMVGLERARELALVGASSFRTDVATDNIAVIDGDLGLDIPTVVLIGDELLRWGAGATWDAALQRALYGSATTIEPEIELAQLATRLDRCGLSIATVDLGSPVLRSAGTHRLSVQLVQSDRKIV